MTEIVYQISALQVVPIPQVAQLVLMMDMEEVDVIVEEVVAVAEVMPVAGVMPADEAMPMEEDVFVGDLHPIHLKW
jgi:hypothetical protein